MNTLMMTKANVSKTDDDAADDDEVDIDDVMGRLTHVWQSFHNHARCTCPSCRWFVYRCRAGRLSTNHRASGWWRQHCVRRCVPPDKDGWVTSDASEFDRNDEILPPHRPHMYYIRTLNLPVALYNHLFTHAVIVAACNRQRPVITSDFSISLL